MLNPLPKCFSRKVSSILRIPVSFLPPESGGANFDRTSYGDLWFCYAKVNFSDSLVAAANSNCNSVRIMLVLRGGVGYNDIHRERK